MQMDLDEEEYRILKTLRSNSGLKESFKEMASISENAITDIKLGDDAEEATVQAIRKAGREILASWLQKRSNQLEQEAGNSQELRPHEKKSSAGKPALERCG